MQEILKRRIVLLGAAGSGKTSLIRRFRDGTFSPTQEVTIGAVRVQHTMEISETMSILLEIWDTAGQERFFSLAPIYYRQAHGVILVYDITSEASLERAKYWHREVTESGPENAIFLLVGNKVDLFGLRSVPHLKGQEFADENGMQFFETSAKTGVCVRKLFEVLGRLLANVEGETNEDGEFLGQARRNTREGCRC